MNTIYGLSGSKLSNSYLLDIPMIDRQHIKFFRLFDQLQQLNKDEESYSKILEVLDELEKYTHIHFKTEEALMRNANAPDYDIHLVQHALFIKKVEDFKFAYTYRSTVLLEQMVTFMRKWFLMHISEVDGKYVENVKQYLSEKELNKELNKELI